MELLAPASSHQAFGRQGIDIFATCFVCPVVDICEFWGNGAWGFWPRHDLSGLLGVPGLTASYGGNRVGSHSPKEGFVKDGGYLSLIQYGRVAFPGQVLALRDGRFVVRQTKYNFVLVGEGY